MRHHTTRNLTAGLLAAGLLLGTAPAALAGMVEREQWSFSESFTDDFCGLDAEFEVEAHGQYMIRADKPGSSAFLFSNVFEWRDVITNPETGAWIVIRGRENHREVKATHVEGDIYRFRVQLAGQHFVIENSDGEVVYRNRGLLVFDQLFDTLGDDEPGGEELSWELVEMRGHPGYLDDICPLALDLLQP
jgi:hypothetical protein